MEGSVNYSLPEIYKCICMTMWETRCEWMNDLYPFLKILLHFHEHTIFPLYPAIMWFYCFARQNWDWWLPQPGHSPPLLSIRSQFSSNFLTMCVRHLLHDIKVRFFIFHFIDQRLRATRLREGTFCKHTNERMRPVEIITFYTHSSVRRERENQVSGGERTNERELQFKLLHPSRLESYQKTLFNASLAKNNNTLFLGWRRKKNTSRKEFCLFVGLRCSFRLVNANWVGATLGTWGLSPCSCLQTKNRQFFIYMFETHADTQLYFSRRCLLLMHI